MTYEWLVTAQRYRTRVDPEGNTWKGSVQVPMFLIPAWLGIADAVTAFGVAQKILGIDDDGGSIKVTRKGQSNDQD